MKIRLYLFFFCTRDMDGEKNRYVVKYEILKYNKSLRDTFGDKMFKVDVPNSMKFFTIRKIILYESQVALKLLHELYKK